MDSKSVKECVGTAGSAPVAADIANISREVKHTPGPWMVSSECDEIVVAEDSVYGVQVADCGKPKGDEYQPAPGEAQANARLISAAPDLLKALKGARNFIVNYVNHKSDLSDFVATLDKAIAKATGGAA